MACGCLPSGPAVDPVRRIDRRRQSGRPRFMLAQQVGQQLDRFKPINAMRAKRGENRLVRDACLFHRRSSSPLRLTFQARSTATLAAVAGLMLRMPSSSLPLPAWPGRSINAPQ